MTSAEKVEALNATLTAIKDTLTALRDIYADHGQGTPDFRMTLDLIKEMQVFLNSRPQSVPTATADSEPPASDSVSLPSSADSTTSAPAPVAAQPVTAAVALPSPASSFQGRQQAVEQLKRVCEWFEANEPSSPVPYFLRRAIRCVGANFMDILEDIAPSAREQVRTVLRPETAGSANGSVTPSAPASTPSSTPAPATPPAEPEGFFNPFG